MRHDRITVVAIAATSAVLSSVTPELLGHGAGCMFAGGRVTGFSTSLSLCDSDPTKILSILSGLVGTRDEARWPCAAP